MVRRTSGSAGYTRAMTDARGADYYPSLTGLRGIAAGWVMLLHLWHYAIAPDVRLPLGAWRLDFTPLFAHGWVGVDLFFVLSGFLLSLPFLAAVRGERPWPRLAHFWAQRCRRVLPAYYVQFFLLFIAAWIATGVAPMGLSKVLAYLGMEFLLYPNLGPLPNPVWWSLPVEWHFYLILPLLALLFVRLRWGLVAVLALAWVVAFRLFCVNLFYVGDPEAPVWYTTLMHLPSRIDEFVFGMIAAWFHARAPRGATRWPALAAGVVLLAWFVHRLGVLGDPLLTVRMPDLLWHYSVAGLAFALIVYAAAGESALAQRLFAGRALAFLGAISYSLYLWHPIVLKTLAEHHVLERVGLDGAAWRFTLPVAPILLVSWFSYRFVERPFLRPASRPRLPQPSPAVG